MSLPKLSQIDDILSILRSMESEENRSGRARFGINVDRALGIKITDLRKLALRIVKGHGLSLQLWESRIHEAKLLATMVDEPSAVTDKQMESWAADFDSWDMVDQACNNLFRKNFFDRVAKSAFVAFCSTESEKCHFRFPYKSMTYIAGH